MAAPFFFCWTCLNLDFNVSIILLEILLQEIFKTPNCVGRNRVLSVGPLKFERNVRPRMVRCVHSLPASIPYTMSLYDAAINVVSIAIEVLLMQRLTYSVTLAWDAAACASCSADCWGATGATVAALSSGNILLVAKKLYGWPLHTRSSLLTGQLHLQYRPPLQIFLPIIKSRLIL